MSLLAGDSWLEWERQLFADLLKDDGLIVMGKGLGVLNLIYRLVKLHSTPKRLVFLLNLSDDNVRTINERLVLEDTPLMVSRITNEKTAQERSQNREIRAILSFLQSQAKAVC